MKIRSIEVFKFWLIEKTNNNEIKSIYCLNSKQRRSMKKLQKTKYD
jgi:hypothetical protein